MLLNRAIDDSLDDPDPVMPSFDPVPDFSGLFKKGKAPNPVVLFAKSIHPKAVILSKHRERWAFMVPLKGERWQMVTPKWSLFGKFELGHDMRLFLLDCLADGSPFNKGWPQSDWKFILPISPSFRFTIGVQ